MKIGNYLRDRLTNTDADNELGPILWALIVSATVAMIPILVGLMWYW